MSLDAATYSLERLLAGVPGMCVSVGRNETIVVTVDIDASEEDLNNLKRIAVRGWEQWPVKIEGMI